jgi:hypothetical protein
MIKIKSPQNSYVKKTYQTQALSSHLPCQSVLRQQVILPICLPHTAVVDRRRFGYSQTISGEGHGKCEGIMASEL